MDDLSDYERVRLDNIKRNEAFMQSLGLTSAAEKKSKADEVADQKKKDSRAKAKAEREKRVREEPAAVGTRSSRRLRVKTEKTEKTEEEEEGDDEAEDEGNQGTQYDRMPFEPQDLDDQEFEVYVRLKKWRLDKCREEELEAYKIFPNRVLCEIIRRKRNNEAWAGPGNREQSIECWGIAAAKFAMGYPTSLLEIMEEEEFRCKLETSVVKGGLPEPELESSPE